MLVHERWRRYWPTRLGSIVSEFDVSTGCLSLTLSSAIGVTWIASVVSFGSGLSFVNKSSPLS